MKKYHLEIIGNDTIYAMLVDQDGEYYNSYKEDSYVCYEGGILRTIKEKANCIWILVDERKKNEHCINEILGEENAQDNS